jgi:cyclopropane-fatty-acyl-phospholipid synthase
VSTPTLQTSDPTVRASLAVLQRLLGTGHPLDFAVRFWDGSSWEPGGEQRPRVTLILRHSGALRSMFWPPRRLTLCEAFLYDDFDVEGDIEAFWQLARHMEQQRRRLSERLRLGWDLFRLPAGRRPRTGRQPARLRGRAHSLARDRQAISYHYDVPADFYALWLDSRMVYSCAYFTTADDDLETAQRNKLDYICRKLRLRPGERLLDIGCGWGGLVIHAAQNYGVEALGITLSRPQVELAAERIRRAGLEGRCRVAELDYREVGAAGGFDKLVSVGMFEHVGAALLPAYFRQAWRLLRPGGVFLNHGIGRPLVGPPVHGPTFVRRYIFPDGELVPISTTLRCAAAAGFEVRDVENLREHYALTLRHWRQRLEARADEARRLTDEVTYRVWRAYTGGAALLFGAGLLDIYQSLLAKPDRGDCRLPLTRADWYSANKEDAPAGRPT